MHLLHQLGEGYIIDRNLSKLLPSLVRILTDVQPIDHTKKTRFGEE